jgi:DNA-binding PadR family transcriptional regulator
MEHKRTAYVLLGLLAIEPDQSGYDLKKTIEGSVGFFWGESYGQLYPTLKQLTSEGLVKSTTPESVAGRKRQLYSITPLGLDALKTWLALPYRMAPLRDEFLLKLFFGHTAGIETTIAQVKEFQTKTRDLVQSLEMIGQLSQQHQVNRPELLYWLLTLEYGLAQQRATLAWSETALAQLTSAAQTSIAQTSSSTPVMSKSSK